MHRSFAVRGGAAAAVLSLAAAAQAVVITDNPVATQAGVIGGLSQLDLSTVVSGLTTVNSYHENFATMSYTGELTATVYGNAPVGSASLTDVLIIYKFVGHGPDQIDQFTFGLDGGSNLDYGDLLSATHGSIGDLRSLGQGNPVVNLTDNMITNDLFVFDFAGGGDRLGGFSGGNVTETFGWYVRATGNVQIGFVDGIVTNFGAANIRTLGLVNIPGQPDLNVPAPATGMALVAGLLATGRRRRA